MSNAAPMMDCEQALQHLYELLDRELTAELEVQVQAHFNNCQRCFPLYEFERAFKRFLKARAETQAAPESLRRKIFDRIMLEESGPE